MIPGTRQSLASMLDITESKETQDALRESENLYRAIFNNTGTASIIIEEIPPLRWRMQNGLDCQAIRRKKMKAE